MKYEGGYFLGEWNGKGKEYYYNGVLKYEGEYLYGEKYGKGKEHHFDSGNLFFDGEYFHNKKWNDNLYKNKKPLLESDFKTKIVKGEAKTYLRNFEVEYLNGKKWNGKGYNLKGELDYEIKNGNGIIKEYFNNDILHYECEYLNGEINGKGIVYNMIGK